MFAHLQNFTYLINSKCINLQEHRAERKYIDYYFIINYFIK